MEEGTRRTIPFKIVRRLVLLNRYGDTSLELNLVSWSGYPAKADLRKWRAGEDGTMHPLKGVTMNRDELVRLRDAVNAYLGEERKAE